MDHSGTHSVARTRVNSFWSRPKPTSEKYSRQEAKPQPTPCPLSGPHWPKQRPAWVPCRAPSIGLNGSINTQTGWHPYLLNELNGLSTLLVFLYFIGDHEMDGPNSRREWDAALAVLHEALGLRGRVPEYVKDAFVDVPQLSPP